MKRCNVGGDVGRRADGATIREQWCAAPVTHRYRTSAHAEGHWSYRCAAHARWLDRNHCTVELLTGGEAG